MLFIITEDYDYTWHVGEKMPDVETVTKRVQADGDELRTIRDQITGIPFSNASGVQKWFGDDARFIVSNLV